MDRIEELRNNLEDYYKDMKKKIEEVEKEELKKAETKKRWRAKRNGTYYLIYDNLDVDDSLESSDSYDDKRYKYRNYFQTREQAEKVAERIKLYMELKDLAEELNGDEEIDWNNDIQRKYSIEYDYYDKKIRQYGFIDCKDLGQIHCLDKDFLEKAKERIGEDRLKKLFEEE